jgi:hypothetical protein
MANRKCWAANLGGCTGKISGEHIASKGVLETAQKMNPRLKLLRTASAGRPLTLSIASAVVNNLCEYHNGVLSPLDSEAQKLMQFVAAAVEPSTMPRRVEAIASRRERMLVRSFDGALLERWALKTFLNHFCARGNAGPRDGVARPSGVHILDTVFNGNSLPPGFGLYEFAEPHKRLYPSQTFSIDTIEVCRESSSGSVLRFPAYIVINFGPLQLAASANVTDLSQEDWGTMINEFWASQLTGRPEAVFHPTSLTLAAKRKTRNGARIPFACARLHWN